MSNVTYSAPSQLQQNCQTKENYVTVLNIYDDPPTTDGIVEITNLESPPKSGLKVSTEPDTHIHKAIVSITRNSEDRSSVNIPKSHSEMSSLLSRTHARKSRFTEAFLDAQERLEAQSIGNIEIPTVSENRSRGFVVTLPSDTVGLPVGIEISAVPDPKDVKGIKLLAVEVRQIEDDGRIAEEGTIRVGDLITEINNRPVYQMSLAKAQADLRSLQLISSPQLVINRRLKSPDLEKGRSTSIVRPVASDLQMANTNKLGDTLTINLEKCSNGFGFGVKSRVNAKNESLIYINRVMPNGPAINKLKIGDRILKINNINVVSHTQKEVVQMLKEIKTGDIVELLISRFIDENETKDENKDVTDDKKEGTPVNSMDTCHKRRQSAFVDIGDDDVQYLTFDVQLQNSKSAGLGISLKGGKLYPENGTLEEGIDCGIFVNGILHGSTAYKDGRFMENDRLIGVENIDLRAYQHNADALAAFSKALSSINGNVVRIRIARARDPECSSALIPKEPARKVQITRSGSESEVSIAPDADAFNRENPSRKSISEKRPGVGNEAIHTQTYQKIVHQRQTSAPQIRSGTLDKFPIPEFKKRQASLTYAKKKYLTAVPIKIGDENESPVPVHDIKSSKRSSISQFFSHLKVGSKKDKNRRQTVVISEIPDLAQKPRSQSHDPRLIAKEKRMVHEVVANGKSELINGKRKKIEPAPSFKQAMSNNVSNPFFDAFVASGLNPDIMSNLRIQANEKDLNRKSLGNTLPKPRAEHRGDPPPYNGPHHHTPTSALNNQFEHRRMHSAHEFFVQSPINNNKPPPVPPRRSKRSKRIVDDNGTLNIAIPGTCTNSINTKARPVEIMDASSSTQRPSGIMDQTCIISSTLPLPTSAQRHSNNAMRMSIKDNCMSFNNVKETQKNITGHPPNSAPLLRRPPPIPPRTITTSSMHGSHRVENNNLQAQTIRTMFTEEEKNKYQDPHLQPQNIDHLMYFKTNTNPYQDKNLTPPPLMPRAKCGRPRLDNGSANRESSVLMHRAPSPHSPLHITSTTADYEVYEPISFVRSTKNRDRSSTLNLQKSQNRNSFINWVKGRKSVDNGDPSSSMRRLRTPSAIFYDPDEHPVKC